MEGQEQMANTKLSEEYMSEKPPLLIDQVLFDIRNFVVNEGSNPHKLALDCKLSPSSLRHMFEEEWNPRYDTLLLVSDYIASKSIYCKAHPLGFAVDLAKHKDMGASPSVDME